MHTADKLHQKIDFSIDSYGDGLPLDFISKGEVILFPSNGNTANLTVTLRYSNGSPAPGKTVNCQVRPLTLSGAEWRNVNSLAPRFGNSQQTIRDRIAQGIIRLGCRVSPTSAVTNANGQVVFTFASFHVCGNEGVPASDQIIVSSEAGTDTHIIKCGIEGLSPLSDNPQGGLTTSGLVGRHLNPQIIQVLQSIGQAWRNVGNKPTGMPNWITVTAASMKWGGLNPPHMTHRFGGSVDIRPIGTQDGPVSVGSPIYHRQATGIIIDFMRQTGASEIRFADNLPGVTVIDASHKDHIHVSWLKTPSEPWFMISNFSSLASHDISM